MSRRYTTPHAQDPSKIPHFYGQRAILSAGQGRLRFKGCDDTDSVYSRGFMRLTRSGRQHRPPGTRLLLLVGTRILNIASQGGESDRVGLLHPKSQVVAGLHSSHAQQATRKSRSRKSSTEHQTVTMARICSGTIQSSARAKSTTCFSRCLSNLQVTLVQSSLSVPTCRIRRQFALTILASSTSGSSVFLRAVRNNTHVLWRGRNSVLVSPIADCIATIFIGVHRHRPFAPVNVQGRVGCLLEKIGFQIARNLTWESATGLRIFW